MKLKELLENLTQIVKENPEALEFDVIYCVDDEGNGYSTVNYTPTLGVYQNGEFWSDCDLQDFNLEESQINSICIN